MTCIVCYIDTKTNTQHFATTTENDIIKYNKNPYKISYIFNVKSDIYEALRTRETNYTTYCTKYGLKPEYLGKTFKHIKDNKCFKIIGFNPNNKKYKFIIQDIDDGKNYKVTPNFINKESQIVTTINSDDV